MPYLNRAGTRIYYEITGQPDGKIPLLLTHGFGSSADAWRRNVGAIDRQVITWDMRGHGRSDSPDDHAAYAHAACVEDMEALLGAVNAGRAVVGGLSLGGFLSLAFSLRNNNRVAALVLASTGPGFRSDTARQQWNEQAGGQAERFEAEGKHGLAHAARGMLAQADSTVIDSLPGIRVPVLIVTGDRDKNFLGAADYLAAKISDATKVTLQDAGHSCNVDQPELFNDSLREFLGRIP
jgi:pimeloyl-ACP methyl ester carboxylesterase